MKFTVQNVLQHIYSLFTASFLRCSYLIPVFTWFRPETTHTHKQVISSKTELNQTLNRWLFSFQDRSKQNAKTDTNETEIIIQTIAFWSNLKFVTYIKAEKIRELVAAWLCTAMMAATSLTWKKECRIWWCASWNSKKILILTFTLADIQYLSDLFPHRAKKNKKNWKLSDFMCFFKCLHVHNRSPLCVPVSKKEKETGSSVPGDVNVA